MENDIQQKLIDIYNECQEKNWDGYGANIVPEETLNMAIKFLEALPEDVIIFKNDIWYPDPGAEPDGDLDFEWYVSLGKLISVSVKSNGDLNYAMLLYENDDGEEKEQKYGMEKFDGKNIPEIILKLIRKIVDIQQNNNGISAS